MTMQTRLFCMFLFLSSISCFDFLDNIESVERCLLKSKDTTVTKHGCGEKKVVLKYCDGRCSSYAMYSSTYPYFKTNCRCCKATSKTVKTVIIPCGDHIVEAEVITEAAKCECKKCSSTKTR